MSTYIYIYTYRYEIYYLFFLNKEFCESNVFFLKEVDFLCSCCWIIQYVSSFTFRKKTHELFLTKNLVLPYNSHPLKPFRNLQSKPSKWNRSNLWVNLKRLELQLGKWGAFENFGVVRDVEPERIDLATQKLNLLVGIFCLWRKGKAA